jgi:hypothetical protein
MAIGDRIIIGDGYSFKENGNSVMVYQPKLDQNGQMIITPDNAVLVTPAGGVKIGSTGVINGPIINVHRTHVHNAMEHGANYGGKDFVQLIPVFFERYQNTAYVLTDNIRIFGSHIR